MLREPCDERLMPPRGARHRRMASSLTRLETATPVNQNWDAEPGHAFIAVKAPHPCGVAWEVSETPEMPKACGQLRKSRRQNGRGGQYNAANEPSCDPSAGIVAMQGRSI